MENINEFVINHNKKFNRSTLFLNNDLKIIPKLGIVMGFTMLAIGYFFIIFKEWLWIGFPILLIGAFITLYLLWENNKRIISFLEGTGYKIDKKLSPLNSHQLQIERLNRISKHYRDEELEFLIFLSEVSKEKSSSLKERKFPMTSIASKVGVAFMTFIISYIMILKGSPNEKFNWILFIFFLSIGVAIIWNFIIRESFTSIDAKIKKYVDFYNDIQEVIFRRLKK